MRPSTALRLLIGIVGAAAVVSGSAAVVLAVIIADTLLFAAWEAVFIGIAFHLAWSPTLSLVAVPWYALLAVALLWLSEPVRREFLS